MRKLSLPFRPPRLESIQFRYLKAGVAVADEAIPWNAETVVVEVLIRGPEERIAGEKDLLLCLPGRSPLPATGVHREGADLTRVVFQLAPPMRTVSVSIFWRWRCLGQLLLPFLSADAFLEGLRLEAPSILTRLAGQYVPGQAFVAGQSEDLLVCGTLTSPTSLIPLVDCGVDVALSSQRTGWTAEARVRLSTPQLLTDRALVALSVRCPEEIDWYSVRWAVAGRLLGHEQVRVLSEKDMQQSLYLADDLYRRDGEAPRGNAGAPFDSRPYPGFLVASREPGLAALCRLDVQVRTTGERNRPRRMTRELLVTHLPAFFLPLESLTGVDSVELFSDGRLLGLLSRYPTPPAMFTAEGAFFAPEYFPWTALAEAELEERLKKLVETVP